MAKRFTDFELQSTVQLVHSALRSGARPPGQTGLGRNALEVAAQDGLSVDAIRRRIQEAERRGMLVDWTLYRPHQYQKPPEVAKITPVHVPATHLKPSGKVVKVCVIPDIHISPEIPNTRMKWMGRWIADRNPDHVVQLGDFLTLDSLSAHAPPDTLSARFLPSFRLDMESGEEAMAMLMEPLGKTPPPLKLTQGNHEWRAERYEDKHPQMAGHVASAVRKLFADNGWRMSNYGEFIFIEGVGFIHHANTIMGRAYGGKTGTQRAASDSTFSFVHGHTHTKQAVDVPKIGPSTSIRGISAGCALPWGHVETYAQHATTGWFWGVLELALLDGIILDETWTSMLTLEARYGD